MNPSGWVWGPESPIAGGVPGGVLRVGLGSW
jgi:hypothetical protein